MIYGALAALGWGFADLVAALSSRRLGVLRTLTLAQIASVISLVVVFVVFRPELGSPSSTDVAVLLALGAFMTVGYATFFRALEVGPVSVVTPIAASYAVIPVLLGPVVLGEQFHFASAMVIGLLVVGLVLTQQGVVASGSPRTGIPLAGIALVTLGLIALALAYYARGIGWYTPVLLLRCGTALTVIAAISTKPRSMRRVASVDARFVLAACGAGVLDNIGFASFARGSEVAVVSIVAAVSATHPLIPVIAGLMLFHERLVSRQTIGISFVIGGLVVLGLTT